MRAAVKGLACVLLVGCSAPASRGTIDDWKLTRAEWEGTVTAPYRGLYDDYARAFDAQRPALAASMRGTYAVRPHFAGDPALSLGQARARWALPVLYPAFVVSPVDAVFVKTARGWGAIVGLDRILVEKAAALDARCATHLEVLGEKRCREIGWEVASAALLGDRRRLAHVCAIAATACARSVVSPAHD